MKEKYLPIMALVVGFIWAFVTAGVQSMLFVLLPLLAFVFGYFSTLCPKAIQQRRRSLANGWSRMPTTLG